MKKMKRLLCLLLVLVSLASVLPMFAAADSDDPEQTYTITIKKKVPSQAVSKYTLEIGEDPVKLKHDKYLIIKKVVYEFSHYEVGEKKHTSLTIPGYDGTAEWEKKWGKNVSVVYKRHTHQYKKSYDRIYHWDTCECGTVGTKVRHVDPTTVTDKTCYCGYTFSSNANLVTLWFANMALSPVFHYDTTEYIGEVFTYRDVTSTSISTRAGDALATIEKPTDMTIREGVNTFQITVTAEDRTTTKTYTVIAVKPVIADGFKIIADGKTISITSKPPIVKRNTAAITLTDAAQEKLVEMIGSETASQITFLPEGSKWASLFTELTLTETVLKALADKGTLDLVLKTPYDSILTIPAAEFSALTGKGPITLKVSREDNTFSILAGEEVLTLSEKITLVFPE